MKTSQEVADMLGLAQSSIRVYAAKYSVGTKRGRDWFFTLEDIAVIREHVERGRGRKSKAPRE